MGPQAARRLILDKYNQGPDLDWRLSRQVVVDVDASEHEPPACSRPRQHRGDVSITHANTKRPDELAEPCESDDAGPEASQNVADGERVATARSAGE